MSTLPKMTDYTLDEYAEDAMRTAGAALDESHGLVLSALGMAGEAGEYADVVKKHVYHDHPLDREKAIKEVGDVLWYVARAARALDLPLSEIAGRNIAKLHARYPEGFTSERSLNRSENQHFCVECGKTRAGHDMDSQNLNVGATRPNGDTGAPYKGNSYPGPLLNAQNLNFSDHKEGERG